MISAQAGPHIPRTDADDLVLIQIIVTTSTRTTRETTWAKHLGEDLYEIQKPLHLVVGFNPHDIVSAETRPGESAPVVTDIIKRSGYKTLHVLFADDLSDEQQRLILHNLQQHVAEDETPFDHFTLSLSHPRRITKQ